MYATFEDAKYCLNGAGFGGGMSGAVCDNLVIILILLVPNPHVGMMNCRSRCGEGDWGLNAIGVFDNKVFCNQGVCDSCISMGGVLAPLTLVESSITIKM